MSQYSLPGVCGFIVLFCCLCNLLDTAFGAARTLLPEGIHCSDDTCHYSVADLELGFKINMSVQDAASGWSAIKIPEAPCGCVVLLSSVSSLDGCVVNRSTGNLHL